MKGNVDKILSTNMNKNTFPLENKNTRKCKHHNRGFCKFGDQCHFQHYSSICQEYMNNGQCKLQDCHSRHPKLCRHWAKKPEGCKRNKKCQYLHDENKKYKSINTIDKPHAIEETATITQSNQNKSVNDISTIQHKTEERDQFIYLYIRFILHCPNLDEGGR